MLEGPDLTEVLLIPGMSHTVDQGHSTTAPDSGLGIAISNMAHSYATTTAIRSLVDPFKTKQ